MNKLLLILLLLVSTSLMAENIPLTAIRTIDMQDICTTKTSTIRDVPLSVKKQVYKNAGIIYGERTLCTQGYEVDHRISLQLGGSNDISNLQLQAYCTKVQLSANFPKTVLYDARAKDAIENSLHKDICSGKITPIKAQTIIYNWSN